MTTYEIQVDIHGDGKWYPSMGTTAKEWRTDLARHQKSYKEPSRAVKIKQVKQLRVLV